MRRTRFHGSTTRASGDRGPGRQELCRGSLERAAEAGRSSAPTTAIRPNPARSAASTVRRIRGRPRSIGLGRGGRRGSTGANEEEIARRHRGGTAEPRRRPAGSIPGRARGESRTARLLRDSGRGRAGSRDLLQKLLRRPRGTSPGGAIPRQIDGRSQSARSAPPASSSIRPPSSASRPRSPSITTRLRRSGAAQVRKISRCAPLQSSRTVAVSSIANSRCCRVSSRAATVRGAPPSHAAGRRARASRGRQDSAAGLRRDRRASFPSRPRRRRAAIAQGLPAHAPDRADRLPPAGARVIGRGPERASSCAPSRARGPSPARAAASAGKSAVGEHQRLLAEHVAAAPRARPGRCGAWSQGGVQTSTKSSGLGGQQLFGRRRTTAPAGRPRAKASRPSGAGVGGGDERRRPSAPEPLRQVAVSGDVPDADQGSSQHGRWRSRADGYASFHSRATAPIASSRISRPSSAVPRRC